MGVRTSSILVDRWAEQVLDWFSDRFGLRRKRNQRLIHLTVLYLNICESVIERRAYELAAGFSW